MAKNRQGAEIGVVHARDDAFEIRIRDHFITVDQPHQDGSPELGPNPTELFVASIGACAAFYARRFLARHGLQDHVAVRTRWSSGGTPSRVTDIEIELRAPGLTDELHERCVAAVARCTLKNTLESPPDLRIDINGPTASDGALRAS